MKLIDDLKWRYATKKFSKKKVSPEDLEQLLEAINLSASSIGMQTYRVFVIDNPALKKELGEGSFNSQIAESSHLLVFAAFTSIDQKIIDNYIQFVATERETPIAELDDFKNMVSSYLLARTDTENFTWSTKQAYIGLGTGLIAAASLKIDTTPMEGFDAEKFDKLLGLKEKNLSSVVVLALGYRDEEKDWNAKLKKVRIPVDEFATHLN
nr:NAD(P)H-dependent oxidoreductase [uncultured Flavobacterium sp.]